MKLRLHLAPRDRRAVTLGAIVLLPALGWSAVVKPYRHARSELAIRVVEQRELLARERMLLRDSYGWARDLRDATDAVENARLRLLPGGNALVATGALVALVGDAARRRSVLVESIETRGAERAAHGLLSVRIDVRGRADFEGLLRWLHALESTPLLLRVDGLSISRFASLAENKPDTSDTETLMLNMTIRGYLEDPR